MARSAAIWPRRPGRRPVPNHPWADSPMKMARSHAMIARNVLIGLEKKGLHRLDAARRLGGDVVGDAYDARDFAHNAVGDGS